MFYMEKRSRNTLIIIIIIIIILLLGCYTTKEKQTVMTEVLVQTWRQITILCK